MANNAENYERVKSLIASLKEMDSYKEKVEGSRVDCEKKKITVLQPGEPCSREISMIYTFNYQMLPSIAKRQGSIFLPMQPKHGIFFVHCEGNAGQVNFLIDEAYYTKNGSNAVISCLHRFFESYGLGETRVDLYCNNGSNKKNNYLLWYLAYNVAKKLHVEHNLDGRRYALKKVSLTKNAVPDEVLKEAKNLAKLEHVNVVRYHTAWLEDEAESELPDAKLSPKLYIQMELCSETLHHMLKGRNEDLVSVSPKERYDQVEKDADSILEQILQGVKYIHSKNIVHGDLKIITTLEEEISEKNEQILVLQKKLSEQKI
uniref:non-specific serine/threonine protein kinase n=1 Tax=Capitella teleta TaxID=283909 RepID=X2AAM0_CAPTE